MLELLTRQLELGNLLEVCDFFSFLLIIIGFLSPLRLGRGHYKTREEW